MEPTPCHECGNKTIEWKGRGMATEYKICSLWREPGHMSSEEINQEINRIQRLIRPAGRFA